MKTSDSLSVDARKIVNGQEEQMGILGCRLATSGAQFTCSMPNGVWALRYSRRQSRRRVEVAGQQEVSRRQHRSLALGSTIPSVQAIPLVVSLLGITLRSFELDSLAFLEARVDFDWSRSTC